jgi:hypothetical protein
MEAVKHEMHDTKSAWSGLKHGSSMLLTAFCELMNNVAQLGVDATDIPVHDPSTADGMFCIS